MMNRVFATRRHTLVWSVTMLVGLGLALCTTEAQAAAPDGFQEVEIEKYGYKMCIPEEFKLEGEVDKTTSWIYQPGSVESSSGKKTTKKLGIRGRLNIKGIGVDASRTDEESSSSSGGGGGLESALTVYVNWTWMPDVDSKTMYDTNLKSTKEDIDSPDPDYTDIQYFDKDEGYEWEGLAYWFKEVDKDKPDEIHRWHIKAFGNKSAYTVGLCGTYEQFQKWGPLYEKAIKTWELIPLKE